MQTLFDDMEDAPAPIQGELRSVLVPYPVDKAYSYAMPDGMELAPGDYVTVPLASREIPAVVWDDPVDENVSPKKLKSIITGHDLPPLPPEHRKFIDWVAHYTMAAKGSVLKMTLSVPGALEPPKPATGYILSPFVMEEVAVEENSKLLTKLSPVQQRVVAVLSDGQARRAAEIAEEADCSSGVVKTMLGKQLVQKTDIFSSAPCRNPNTEHGGVELSQAQYDAAKTLVSHVEQGGFCASLLDGVTGAGKTEVYFEAVAKALEQGKQVLLLLPEIALSNAFLDRFKKRFGCAPGLWHSGLSAGARKRTWRGVATGETRVIVGARSALFLPYKELGLIVVDEEHDPAYKQEDNVIYNARDMAIVRAHIGQFPITLISATPSLETISNCWAGRYEHINLPHRHGGATMPEMELIDMRIDKPEDKQHFLSPVLVEQMERALGRHEQALLFLNRRGYAPLTLCRTCGHRFECPRCTAWLVEHKKSQRLHCHHCGFYMRVPKECPGCNDSDSLAACGPGVERIHEEVKEHFPDARIIVMASDTLTGHDELREKLQAIRDHEYDIIIGTQVIAKGHHFPDLTCVGVVDADLGLKGGDLRAAERTFQLLHQVAGRAGREDKQGHVFLQTYLPDNKVMQALTGHERDMFYEIESDEREESFMPPYSRLAGIIVAGKDEQMVMEISRELGKCAPQGPDIHTLGPAEAPFYRLRGTYRRRLLIQADKKIDLQKAIDSWLANVKTPSTIRIYVDIDPQSFL
jgi:primosomal protein N' (replication factor Y)